MSPRSKLIIPVAVIIVAVAVALALSPMMQDGDRDRSQAHAFPGPIEEEDRNYPPASVAEESYGEKLDALRSSLSDPTLDASAMAAAIKESKEDINRIYEWYAWAELDYHERPAEYQDEYEGWSNLAYYVYNDYAAVMKESLSGPCADTVEEATILCGLDPDEYRDIGKGTQEERDLSERETSLLAGYTSLMTEDYVMTYGGSTWTLDSIYGSDTLTDSRKTELAMMLLEERYLKAAEIYIDLVEIRNDIAAPKGYGNYAEYSYKENYGREYSPSVARSYADLVASGVEIYKVARDAIISDGPMSLSRLAWMYDLEGDEFIDAAEPFIDSVGEEFARLLDYMIEYDLIDICDIDGRIRSSYSNSLEHSGGAVIYMGGEEEGEEWNGFRALIHEFGHAAAFSLNPNGGGCRDLNEIDSQGLEALCCASGLIGNDSSDAMSAYTIYQMSWLMFMTGMMTELELWAYETEATEGSLTTDQICDEFSAIQDKFDIHFDMEFDGKYYWMDFNQIFAHPNNYIGYGITAVSAIELFVNATEDYDAAKEKYLNLMFQQGVYGYSAAVKEAGLTDAFDTEAAKAVLERCVAVLKSMED